MLKKSLILFWLHVKKKTYFFALSISTNELIEEILMSYVDSFFGLESIAQVKYRVLYILCRTEQEDVYAYFRDGKNRYRWA